MQTMPTMLRLEFAGDPAARRLSARRRPFRLKPPPQTLSAPAPGRRRAADIPGSCLTVRSEPNPKPRTTMTPNPSPNHQHPRVEVDFGRLVLIVRGPTPCEINLERCTDPARLLRSITTLKEPLIGRPEADVVFPFVFERLRLGQASERARAADVLSQLGASAQGALPLLEEIAANDPFDYTREKAQIAIRAIRENRPAEPFSP
jgi:hypothetical protein